jgi:hypothetical protein
MGVNVRDARRGNVDWLIRVIYDGQSSLADALGHVPNQRKLSYIQRNERGMSILEARNIEQVLVIPVGWMDG